MYIIICGNVNCGKEFETYDKRRKYCSQKCYLENPNYKNPMLGKKRPDMVEYNIKYKSDQIRGDKNPNKRKEVIDKRKNTIRGRTKEIYGRLGPLNKNWRGGTSFLDYSYEFNKELKLAIKIRDKYRCNICKTHEDETPQGLSIHHIDYDKKNNNTNNLVALCPKCHLKTNGNRQRWIEYFSRHFNLKKQIFTYQEISDIAEKVSDFLKNKNVTGLYPIWRGGVVPAVMLSYMLKVPLVEKIDKDSIVIVDEIVDFGLTVRKFKTEYPDNLFVCLFLNIKNFKQLIKPDFYAEETKDWIVFPWEQPWDDEFAIPKLKLSKISKIKV